MGKISFGTKRSTTIKKIPVKKIPVKDKDLNTTLVMKV